MKVSELTGRSANILATSPNREESGVCSKTRDTAPIATPMTARSTTGASLQADRQRLANRNDHQQSREYGQSQNDIEHWV